MALVLDNPSWKAFFFPTLWRLFFSQAFIQTHPSSGMLFSRLVFYTLDLNLNISLRRDFLWFTHRISVPQVNLFQSPFSLSFIPPNTTYKYIFKSICLVPMSQIWPQFTRGEEPCHLCAYMQCVRVCFPFCAKCK